MDEKKDSKATYEEYRKKKSMKFTVYIDDNFHYMDESERITRGTFSTAEEAIDECKSIVDWVVKMEKAACKRQKRSRGDIHHLHTVRR